MDPRIASAQVDLWQGRFKGDLPIKDGLTLLSGVNGTGKTQVLRLLKENRFTRTDGQSGGLKVAAFSPKRNTERKNLQQVAQEIRNDNQDLGQRVQGFLNQNMNDNTFQNYGSISDLYMRRHHELSKDGHDRRKHMEAVTKEFNSTIGQIFQGYQFVDSWNEAEGRPDPRLEKSPGNVIELHQLSTGEQEILSLALNVANSADYYDVFLIDEPEVHLNWHLEERLFAFLNAFAKERDKQIIVATHSRVVFLEPFAKQALFLSWKEGQVTWSDQPDDNVIQKLAGEAIQLIRMGDFQKPTFFVEDEAHEEVVHGLMRVLSATATVSVCGSRPNVESLYKASRRDGGWPNAFFVTDGDDRVRRSHPDDPSYIQLDKYCMENYLLNFEVAASISNRTEEDIRTLILDAIRSKKDKIFQGKNRFFSFVVERITLDDIQEPGLSKVDASEFLDAFILSLDMDREGYLKQFIDAARAAGKLTEVFPEGLVKALAPVEQVEVASVS